jgi:hypothetical protein
MRAREEDKVMTLEQAKSLERGEYVHHVTKKNADGTPMRARVTSVKTWKTRPGCVEVHVKHGLYDYATFSAIELRCIERGQA